MSSEKPGVSIILPPGYEDEESVVADQRERMSELIADAKTVILFTADSEGNTRMATFGNIEEQAELLVIGNMTMRDQLLECATSAAQAKASTKQ